MARPGPAGLSSAERADMWCRWKAGYRMREIARALRCDHGSIRNLLAQRGGIGPSIRHRAKHVLTLAEREDISRGKKELIAQLRTRRTLRHPRRTGARDELRGQIPDAVSIRD